MKTYSRSFLISAFAFWTALKFVDGLTLTGNWQNFVLITAFLFVSSFIIKPIIKLIFLPVNLLTFNAVSILVTAATLFAASFLIPEFKITPFTFRGFVYNGLILPSVELNYLLTLLAAAIIITLVITILNWFVN